MQAVFRGPGMDRAIMRQHLVAAEDQCVVDQDPERMLAAADVGAVGGKFFFLVADEAQELLVGEGIHRCQQAIPLAAHAGASKPFGHLGLQHVAFARGKLRHGAECEFAADFADVDHAD